MLAVAGITTVGVWVSRRPVTDQLSADLRAKPSPLEKVTQDIPVLAMPTAAERQHRAMKQIRSMGTNALAVIPDLIEKLDEARPQEAIVTLKAIGLAAEPALIEATSHTNAIRRRNALIALRVIQSTNRVRLLNQALHDSDPDVRQIAARHLASLGENSTEVLPKLIERLEAAQDETAIRGCSRVIADYGEGAKEAIPALLKIVDKGSYNEIVGGAGYALKRIDAKAATQAVIARLDAKEPEVRRGAAMLVIELKEDAEPAIPALIKHLHDDDQQTRIQCAVGLREIARQGDVVAPALIDCLSDTDEKFRGIAAVALRSYPEQAKKAVPKIIEILRNTEDELVATGLFTALSYIDPAAAQKLAAEQEAAAK